jgi:hypothetical protein
MKGPTPEEVRETRGPNFVDLRATKGGAMGATVSAERKRYIADHHKNTRQQNREAYNAYMREWRNKHIERSRALINRGNAKKNVTLRQAVLAFWGGKCVRCGFEDWRALQIDHIDGGAYKEGYKGTRAKPRKPNRGPYEWLRLIKAKPDEMRLTFQVLCSNCNWIKRYENNELGAKVVAWNEMMEKRGSQKQAAAAEGLKLKATAVPKSSKRAHPTDS